MLAGQQGGDGGVDASAHGHERALRVERPAPRSSAAAAPSARWSASAARSAAWNLPGDSPPSSAAIACGLDARGVEHVRAVDQRDGGRAGRRHRPAAGGLEAGGDDALAVDGDGDADQVAAGGAAGGAVMGAGRAQAQPGGMLEVLAEGLHERGV